MNVAARGVVRRTGRSGHVARVDTVDSVDGADWALGGGNTSRGEGERRAIGEELGTLSAELEWVGLV